MQSSARYWPETWFLGDHDYQKSGVTFLLQLYSKTTVSKTVVAAESHSRATDSRPLPY
jgi:hypothetical protein